MPRKLRVGGMHRNANTPTKAATVKKVAPPVVPEMATSRLSVSSYTSSGYGSGQSATSSSDRNSFGSIGPDDAFPPPPSPNAINGSNQAAPSPTKVSCDHSNNVYAGRTQVPPSGISSNVSSLSPHSNQQHIPYSAHQYQNKKPNGSPCSPLDSEIIKSGHYYHNGNYTQLHFLHGHYQTQCSLEDQGIDMTQSPGRDSPGSSTGSTASSGGSGIASGGGSSSACRNSTSSLDSGRASVFDGGRAPVQHRLSGQSYESSSSSSTTSSTSGIRPSCHSSSSSLGSMDKLEEGTTYASSLGSRGVNVASMIMHGVDDGEILSAWLSSLNFEEYIGLFIQAGYDMPTISRMTPEDLTAVGITRPGHRKRLKSEIMKLNIPDGLPEYKPNSVEEWLRLLRLEQYAENLSQQGYSSVDQMTSVAWEDLEDIGITLLGHQKKMMLAIKRIKDINAGKPLDRHRHNVEMAIGSSASLPRPSSVNVTAEVQYPYGYKTEQITVQSLHQPMPIISHGDNQAVPEFKTFQQSSPQGEFHYRRPGEPTSPTRPRMYDSDIINAQMRHSPSRGRSIEALNVMDYNNHNHQVYNNSWYDMTWRRNSFDQTSGSGDVTPTNEGFMEPDYPMIGSNSLPRPKVLVKPRPVAKIMAKSRQTSAESVSHTFAYNHDIEAAKMHLQSDSIDAANKLNSSKIYGTTGWKNGGKKAPPAPPKRTNSVKSDSTELKTLKEQDFASQVKSLTSSFNMGDNKNSGSRGDRPSPTPSDELPPPPAPLLSTQFYSTNVQMHSTAQGLTELKQRLETIHNKSPVRRISQSDKVPESSISRQDLNKNRQKSDDRSSSSDSSMSTSSCDSVTALPFANDNIGTIKQRFAKGPVLSTLEDIRNRSPSLSPSSSPSSTLRKPSLPSKIGEENQSRQRDSLCSDRTSSGSEASSSDNNSEFSKKRNQDTGNVLNDIDNMLADLNDELNAILENDQA